MKSGMVWTEQCPLKCTRVHFGGHHVKGPAQAWEYETQLLKYKQTQLLIRPTTTTKHSSPVSGQASLTEIALPITTLEDIKNQTPSLTCSRSEESNVQKSYACGIGDNTGNLITEIDQTRR